MTLSVRSFWRVYLLSLLLLAVCSVTSTKAQFIDTLWCGLQRGNNHDIGTALTGGSLDTTILVLNSTTSRVLYIRSRASAEFQSVDSVSATPGTYVSVPIRYTPASAFDTITYYFSVPPKDSCSKSELQIFLSGKLGLPTQNGAVYDLQNPQQRFIGMKSATDTPRVSINLRNNSAKSMTITSIAPTSKSFSVRFGAPLPYVLTAGQSVPIDLEFAGKPHQLESANLIVMHDIPVITESYRLEGLFDGTGAVRIQPDDGELVSVFPNPLTDRTGDVTLQLTGLTSSCLTTIGLTGAHVEIRDLLGRTLEQEVLHASSWQWRPADAAAGVYYLVVSGRDARGEERRIVRRLVLSY